MNNPVTAQEYESWDIALSKAFDSKKEADDSLKSQTIAAALNTINAIRQYSSPDTRTEAFFKKVFTEKDVEIIRGICAHPDTPVEENADFLRSHGCITSFNINTKSPIQAVKEVLAIRKAEAPFRTKSIAIFLVTLLFSLVGALLFSFLGPAVFPLLTMVGFSIATGIGAGGLFTAMYRGFAHPGEALSKERISPTTAVVNNFSNRKRS